MEANPTFFKDLAYVFLAALTGGMLAWRLRQPIILGYVLAGMLISPFTPGPAVEDVHTLELFAEIGVILLMFSIGLEFSVKDLLRAKWVALIGAPIGILLSIALGLAVSKPLGWSPLQGVIVGSVISVASTMVLTRLLMDRGELQTEHGLVMVSITLIEDLAVVVMTVLIPSLASFEGGRLLAIAQGLGKAAIILIPALFIASRIVPPLLTRVARTHSQELFFMVVLAICMGTAALTQATGLSLALGAFVAGLIISGSQYAHVTLAQLFPFRDAFVALFFVTIGLLVNPNELFSNVPLLATMIGLIVVGKFMIWTVVVQIFRYPIWTAVLVAIGLTQIGEFSFILVQVARNAGIVGRDIYNATLAASLMTILINAAMVKYLPRWIGQLRRTQGARRHAGSGAGTEEFQEHVVICGYGRIGSAIGTALETFGIPFFIVENDPDTVKALSSRGMASIFGDPAHIHILEKAGVRKANLVVITLPELGQSQLAVSNARRLNPEVPILARAHRAADRESLLNAGATEVIQPEVEAAAVMLRKALGHLRLSEDQKAAYLERFREVMESLQIRPFISPVPFPEIQEMTLDESILNGQSLRDAQIRERFGVTVVAIIRSSGEVLVNPLPETILQQGDKLRVFGLIEQIKAFAATVGK